MADNRPWFVCRSKMQLAILQGRVVFNPEIRLINPAYFSVLRSSVQPHVYHHPSLSPYT